MAIDRAARPARPAGALRASPYFSGLSDRWLRRLAQAASRRAIAAGDELEVGETACLYLVVAGEVSASTAAGREAVAEVVAREGPGGVFGMTGEEEALVYRAVTPVDAYVWEQPALERLLDADAELRRQLETRLSLRRRRSELVELLRRTPLFRHAGQSLIRWLVESATLGWFAPEGTICRQGDEGDAMFLIVSGEVAFYQEGVAGPFRHLHRGDFFGEIALIRRSIRTASAVAVIGSEVLIVGRDAFDALYRRSAPFRNAVRVTAELRLASDTTAEPDPELVWLVNDTAHPGERVAALVARSLENVVGEVAGPLRLPRAGGVQAVLEAGRRQGAAYALCFSEKPLGRRAARELADVAGTVVHFTDDAAASFPYHETAPHRVLHVVVSEPGGAGATAAVVRRDAFTLRGLPADGEDGRLRRLARAIGRRRVGVALGGGAAWGYAHVALLRGLEREQIPIDVLVGVSMGSIVGAFYASQGLSGLDRLVDARLDLSATALAAIGTMSAVDVFLRRHIPERRLEELSVPFVTVAVEAATGRERAFRHGSLAAAVRASCSLPGVFGGHLRGGRRYLDAAVRNNIPASYCLEADADFVIASDVVPSPRASRDMPSERRLTGILLNLSQVNRLTDTIRSLYWLAGDSGRRQAAVADAVFTPDLSDFYPWDFHRARAIVETAEAPLEDWLVATRARYRTLAQAGRADG